MPNKQVIVLGLESSCDETAAAVVTGEKEILSNVVLSQNDAHAPFGGVVPEIAARAHVTEMDRLVDQAMTEAGVSYSDLSAVAATAGPGLIGGVLVGLTKFRQQLIQAANEARYALGEFRAVEKQDTARHRNLPNYVPDRGYAVVQRLLWIGERVATLIADDSPFLHLVAAKNRADGILDIDNQQSV